MAEILWLHVATVGACFVSGLVPLVSAELYLLGVAALADPGALPTLAAAAAVGQMGAKTLMYFAGTGVVRLRRLERHQARLDALRLRVQQRGTSTSLLLFGSASVGLPPFFIVSVLAGALRVPLVWFLVLGTAGRFVRFAVVLALPAVLRALA